MFFLFEEAGSALTPSTCQRAHWWWEQREVEEEEDKSMTYRGRVNNRLLIIQCAPVEFLI